MSGRTRVMQNVIAVSAGFILAGVWLLSFPTAAQQSGPQTALQAGSQIKQGTISDDDFVLLHQQIRELKNPTFRAFLTIRLLSWKSPEPTATRRQAELEVATRGITDLCEHQNEVWTPTASWLHEGFVKQIKTIQTPEQSALEICALKTETKNNSEKDLSSGIKMLSNPETSTAGLNLAKSAILSGHVSAETMLGQLLRLNAAHSPYLPELLSTVLLLEEKQPGTLPLRMMPFFLPEFLDKSVGPEITTRFLLVAVRSTRLSAEELAKLPVRGQVASLLNGIINSVRQLAPALYPEVASRLSSLNGNAPDRMETRLAAEERIQKASDQLEQLISEANSASDEQLKRAFFSRAARLAKEQGQLSQAVDLAMTIATSTWIDDFLMEISSLAVKKRSPSDATYAISKMTRPFKKAQAFRLLGEYYGASDDKVKSKEAFTQSAKQLKSVASSNEKVKTSLLLAQSVLKYEPADAYEVFRESVKAINNLPSPEKEEYYRELLPVAEELIRSFRLLAIRENQTAKSLAVEIRLSELRLSALSGAYSGLALKGLD